MAKKEKYRQKLLVEGNDDEHVMYALFVKFEVNTTFDVVNTEGISKLISSIPVWLKADIDTLGIIVDADTDVMKRWEEIIKILVSNGYDEIDPSDNGIIVTKDKLPKIGVWVMPDNSVCGMLEDFIRYLVIPEDKLLPIAEKITKEIESDGLNKYIEDHHMKAVIHTWLAWQEDPGTPMGFAITKSYLTTNVDLCKKFIEWVNMLYN